MNKDLLIILAWPEGMTTAAGAWYDKYFAKNGKYRVGHSALVLVNSTTRKLHYFDFGRYHTPIGFGRIRDSETDPDLSINRLAEISNNQLTNIKQILLDTHNNVACHGEGKLYASVVNKVNFSKAFRYAKRWQKKGAISYGPFTLQGTNCSRFVAEIARKAIGSYIIRLRLRFPFCLSPSPKRNVAIGNKNYYVVGNGKCIKINRGLIKAYFSTIEI